MRPHVLRGLVVTACALALSPAAHAGFVTLDVPGGTATTAYGIDGGTVVGSYSDGTREHGFLYTPDIPVSAVPAPPAAVLAGLGAVTLLGGARLRRRAV